MNETSPQTLIEAVRYFTDLDVCHNYMVKLKWPDGKIFCPKCGCDNVGTIAKRRMFQCKDKNCRKQFSAKVGTIFEDSRLGLGKWFLAAWQIANAKNGISSMELHRALGVTQKTAWFMLHRIRLAMKTGDFRKLSGVVESNETYIGGKAENMHARKRARKILGRGTVGKAIVHGILECGDKAAQDSKVRCTVVPDTEQSTLVPLHRPQRGALRCRLHRRSRQLRGPLPSLRSSRHRPCHGLRSRQGPRQRHGKFLVSAQADGARNLCYRRAVPPGAIRG